MEPQTPRKTAAKRATSRAPRKRVQVNVEQIPTHVEDMSETEPNNYVYMSPADRLAMHMAMQRAQLREEKRSKYKRLLEGAI
jgi:hypothetical protein